MKNDRKRKLMDLGVESLADALLELAVRFEGADDLVERLIAAPRENIQRFKDKLSGLKWSQHFIDWRASSGFARELEALLREMSAGVSDPFTGVELVAAFYETDNGVLGQCDDSSGHVGDVYRYDAKALFVDYASRCPEKDKIADIILKLNRKDSYGVRDTLIYCAGEFLPEPCIRRMITALQTLADGEADEYERRHHLMLIEALARQIKDAKLFEQTRIASWGKLSTAGHIDIARVYLESGDVQTAQSWLGKIPEDETYQASERDKLLLEIYRQLGDTKKLTELQYRQFRLYRSTKTLQELLDVIGNDRRDEVISTEIAQILEKPELRESDAEFLISLGKTDEAEEYLLKRAEQLDGDFYSSMLYLAETMEADKRNLAASLIYRSLLSSILERGYTKAYHHGVRYLKKLDKLAVLINNWREFDTHETYKDQIYQAHGRKRSFWSKYKAKK